MNSMSAGIGWPAYGKLGYDIIPYVALQRSKRFGRPSSPAHTIPFVLCRLADTLVPPLRSGPDRNLLALGVFRGSNPNRRTP
jgi:hypothetical protein